MISAALHFSALVLAVVITYLANRQPKVAKIEFEVIAKPQVTSQPLNIEKLPPPPPPEPEKVAEPRKVFGVSRKALTVETSEEAGAAIKQGNTLATAPDDEKLRDDDVDTIPIPTDEYLVTAMPSVMTEVRVDYPPQAKEQGIEGPVVMDLLIDDQGAVRQARLIQGPGFGLDEAALEAIRRFRFRPARVGEQAVAVKIRYTYRFVLE